MFTDVSGLPTQPPAGPPFLVVTPLQSDNSLGGTNPSYDWMSPPAASFGHDPLVLAGARAAGLDAPAAAQLLAAIAAECGKQGVTLPRVNRMCSTLPLGFVLGELAALGIIVFGFVSQLFLLPWPFNWAIIAPGVILSALLNRLYWRRLQLCELVNLKAAAHLSGMLASPPLGPWLASLRLTAWVQPVLTTVRYSYGLQTVTLYLVVRRVEEGEGGVALYAPPQQQQHQQQYQGQGQQQFAPLPVAMEVGQYSYQQAGQQQPQQWGVPPPPPPPGMISYAGQGDGGGAGVASVAVVLTSPLQQAGVVSMSGGQRAGGQQQQKEQLLPSWGAPPPSPSM